jgi:N-acetylmuramoyl-L-alanine amidase
MTLTQNGFRRHHGSVSRLIFGIFLVFSPVFSVLCSDWDREGAKRAWEEASRDRKVLSSSLAPSRESYLKCAKTYQLVYLKDPHYGFSDDAVYEAARLFQEMGEKFGDQSDFRSAVKLYRFLTTGYGMSPFCPDALLRLATISEVHLADPQSAQSAYKLLGSRYRSSQAAATLAARSKSSAGSADAPVTSVVPVPVPNGEKSAAPHMPASASAGNSDGLVLVRDLLFSSNKDSTRVSIVTDGEIGYSKSHLQNPERIFFDIAGARLDRSLVNKTFTIEDKFLKVVRVGQNRSDTVRVVLELSGAGEFAITEFTEAFGVAIDIRDRGVAAAQTPQTPVAANLASPAAEKRREPSLPSQAAGKASESSPPREVPETPPQSFGTLFAASKDLVPSAGKAEAGMTTPPPKASIPQPPILMEPHPSPKMALPTSSGDRTLTRMLGLKIGRIVLDPGHGGYDTGSIGPSGLLEKDLVLQVAIELRKLLQEKLGAEVFLTRSDDTFISLEERTAIANKHKADLFLSIHANSSTSRNTSGVETYFLDFARTDAAREVAARENATTDRNIRDLQNLIGKIARAEKIEESKELASVVQKNLYHGVRKILPSSKDRGVRSAPFIVLIGANMPSVLAEVAFISNPRDEKQLKKEASQESLATSLFQGIQGYMKTLGTEIAQNRGNSN